MKCKSNFFFILYISKTIFESYCTIYKLEILHIFILFPNYKFVIKGEVNIFWISIIITHLVNGHTRSGLLLYSVKFCIKWMISCMLCMKGLKLNHRSHKKMEKKILLRAFFDYLETLEVKNFFSTNQSLSIN